MTERNHKGEKASAIGELDLFGLRHVAVSPSVHSHSVIRLKLEIIIIPLQSRIELERMKVLWRTPKWNGLATPMRLDAVQGAGSADPSRQHQI